MHYCLQERMVFRGAFLTIMNALLDTILDCVFGLHESLLIELLNEVGAVAGVSITQPECFFLLLLHFNIDRQLLGADLVLVLGVTHHGL